jgi:hypothetical protein
MFLGSVEPVGSLVLNMASIPFLKAPSLEPSVSWKTWGGWSVILGGAPLDVVLSPLGWFLCLPSLTTLFSLLHQRSKVSFFTYDGTTLMSQSERAGGLFEHEGRWCLDDGKPLKFEMQAFPSDLAAPSSRSSTRPTISHRSCQGCS